MTSYLKASYRGPKKQEQWNYVDKIYIKISTNKIKVIRNVTFFRQYFINGASLVTQMVTNGPAMQDTWVQSLGPEDPLEKGMATYPNIPAWKIPWPAEPGGL